MHLALPQTMTKENLAAWITDNSIEERTHDDKFDLTKEEIQKFEHDSSVASRAIDRLEELKEKFVERLKDGTQEPVDFTVPPTKGLKVLKENREFADTQIELGYRTQSTPLYAIPYPETHKIIFFDVEGNHWEQYDYKMNPNQLQKYDKPMLAEMSVQKKSTKKKETEEFKPTASLPFPSDE